MKAISLWQPWATLIALGHKRFETRSWGTPYRGPIAIHAAKRPIDFDTHAWLAQHAEILDFTYRGEVDVPVDTDEYPLGCIVATAQLVACHRTEDKWHEVNNAPRGEVEIIFGDWSANRFAWELADLKRLEPVIPCRGAQGIWSVPVDVLEQIRRQSIVSVA